MLNTSQISTAIRFGLWLLCGAAVVFILNNVAHRFTGQSIAKWDDAYMYVRYVDNMLAEGRVAFNPGGETTYGLTSLAYLLVVLPMRLLSPGSPPLTMIVSSVISGVLMIGATMVMLKKGVASEARETRHFVIALAIFSLAYGRDSLTPHFVSGMDTMFALLYVTGYILVSHWHQRSLSWLTTVVTSCLGGLAFAVRPDLLIYTTILPFISILFADSGLARKRATWILVGTVSLVLVQMGVCALYFQSPLPLPFYAKGLGLYTGQAIQDYYRPIPWRELRLFVQSYPVLFSLVGVCLVFCARSWWKKSSSLDKGLLLATVVFISYYLFFVMQIMYYWQRFYYPTLPAILFLAARSVLFLNRRYGISEALRRHRRRPIMEWVVLTAIILGIISMAFKISKETRAFVRKTPGLINAFDMTEVFRKMSGNAIWFCLDGLSTLPDDCSIATSEVGCPLAMNPRKKVIDLVGLNETTTAHEGLSAERLFHSYQPDIVYLPHPHYEEFIREIQENQFFRDHYEFFPAELIKAQMGLALYKNSKYYDRMHEIVATSIDSASVP